MKQTFIALFALLLSACGFTPVHAPATSAGATAFSDIKVTLIDPKDMAHEEGAFALQQALYDRLGTSGSKHTLMITPTFVRPGIGITSDDVASRFDMRISVRYQLVNSADGLTLDSGVVRAVTTFGAPRDPYGLISAEKNATQNVAREAADRLLIRLSAYYAQADKP